MSAQKWYDAGQSAMPDDTASLLASAAAHHQAGQFAEAEGLYRQILSREPQNSDALHLLGLLAYQAGHRDDALKLVQAAIQIRGDRADYFSHLGVILLSLGRINESIGALRRAKSLSPYDPALLTNLGMALAEGELYPEAIAAYSDAIRLNPNLPHARMNLGLAQLLTGDFAHGWDNFESRLALLPSPPSAKFSQPQWDGKPLNGRTILLQAEQGFGDTIQFIRYAPFVAARGGRVIVACQSAVHRLLAGFPAVEQFISEDESPGFDVQSSLLSLPGLFGTDLSSIPNPSIYLKPAPELLEVWKRKLVAYSPGLKVGLAWAGSATNLNDRKRSIPLSQFQPMADLPRVMFYSLQKGPAAAQAASAPPGLNLIDLTGEISDFADTAALIANLDLVISVDTAVAHLAGAIGKQVWILLPTNPDWRWMLGRDDSPWYPTMRLFRQPETGNWPEVISRVNRSLQASVNK
jgi:tetratricopeptide (TPR) repeat protein